MTKLIGCLLFFVLTVCGLADPPSGYSVKVFDANFLDGSFPLSEWGPIPPYDITKWQNQTFISHTPYDGDFGYAKFSIAGSHQQYGKWWFQATKDSSGQWHSGYLASVDTNGTGFSQSAPCYWEVVAQMPPTGRDVWPAIWLEDMLSIQRQNRTATESEIDIAEFYGNNINNQEIHTHQWAANGGGIGGSSANVQHQEVGYYPHTYGCLVEASQTTFYFDGQVIWTTPTLPEMLHPMYIMVDLALQDRSFTGQPYSDPGYAKWGDPGQMSIQSVRCYTPTLKGQSKVTVAWDNPAGYNLYYGTTKGGPYPTKINVGNVSSYTINGLTSGVTYYAIVKSYSASGVESSCSTNEITLVAP